MAKNESRSWNFTVYKKMISYDQMRFILGI